MRTAIGELTPMVGVRAACEAFDFPRASFYRKGFWGCFSGGRRRAVCAACAGFGGTESGAGVSS